LVTEHVTTTNSLMARNTSWLAKEMMTEITAVTESVIKGTSATVTENFS